MNSLRAEYLDEPSRNGNGHANGNADKIFHLTRATDADTLVILEARRRALEDKRLTISMKACFCRVLDLALHPKFYDAKGVVTISDTRIAKTFGVSARTVYNWKRDIAAAGYWWISKKFVTNMYPLTVYHISCLDRPGDDRRTDEHGTYGGEHLRPEPKPALGARRPGQPGLALPGSGKGAPKSKTATLQPIAGESGKTVRLSAETDCGSQPKPIAGESRNPLRLRAETHCGSEPKPIAGESRNVLQSTPETDCRLLESQKEPESQTKIEGKQPPPDLAFDKWVKGLDRMFAGELERLELRLKADHRAARSAAAKKQIARKLAAVTERLIGPSPDDEPAAPKPAPITIPAAPEPTEDEMICGAEFLVNSGKPHLLTESQKAALAKARGTKQTPK
jgi:hypothetical protein